MSDDAEAMARCGLAYCDPNERARHLKALGGDDESARQAAITRGLNLWGLMLAAAHAAAGR